MEERPCAGVVMLRHCRFKYRATPGGMRCVAETPAVLMRHRKWTTKLRGWSTYIICQIHYSSFLHYRGSFSSVPLYSGIRLLGVAPRPNLAHRTKRPIVGRLRSRGPEAWPKPNCGRGAIDNDVLSSASLSSVSPATDDRRRRAPRTTPCDPHRDRAGPQFLVDMIVLSAKSSVG